jgi:hypothetical protein
MIACGHCHQYHPAVADVKLCASVGPPRGAGATDKQLNWLKSLCAERGRELPDGLTKKAASALIDELLKTPKIASPTPSPSVPLGAGDAIDVPIGTFTLVRADGSYRTLQLGHPKWAGGKLVAAYLCGSDNELSYRQCAFIASDGRVSLFRKFQANASLRADLESFIKCTTGERDAAHERFLGEAEAFAMRSGRCMRCAHRLTVPASLFRGLGPVCAGIEGVA